MVGSDVNTSEEGVVHMVGVAVGVYGGYTQDAVTSTDTVKLNAL